MFYPELHGRLISLISAERARLAFAPDRLAGERFHPDQYRLEMSYEHRSELIREGADLGLLPACVDWDRDPPTMMDVPMFFYSPDELDRPRLVTM